MKFEVYNNHTIEIKDNELLYNDKKLDINKISFVNYNEHLFYIKDLNNKCILNYPYDNKKELYRLIEQINLSIVSNFISNVNKKIVVDLINYKLDTIMHINNKYNLYKFNEDCRKSIDSIDLFFRVCGQSNYIEIESIKISDKSIIINDGYDTKTTFEYINEKYIDKLKILERIINL